VKRGIIWAVMALAVVLTACGPLGGLRSYEPIIAPILDGGASVTATARADGLYEVLFQAGPSAAEQVTLTITAPENASLKVNDARCRYLLEANLNMGLYCDLGTIEAGKGYLVIVKANGLPSADALFFRPGSKIPRRAGTPVFTQ
jgi:hypothetical protein